MRDKIWIAVIILAAMLFLNRCVAWSVHIPRRVLMAVPLKTGKIDIDRLILDVDKATQKNLRLADFYNSIHDTTEIGYLFTGGNTELETLSVKNELTMKIIDVDWESQSHAFISKSNGERVAENYRGNGRAIYKFIYSELQWKKDTFIGLDARYNVNTGLTFMPIDEFWHSLTTDIGFNYIHEDRTNVGIKQTPAIYVRGKYEWAYLNAVVWGNEFISNFDLDVTKNFEIDNELYILFNISKLLAFKNGYTLKYRNDPVPTFNNTDHFFTFSLVVKWR